MLAAPDERAASRSLAAKLDKSNLTKIFLGRCCEAAIKSACRHKSSYGQLRRLPLRSGGLGASAMPGERGTRGRHPGNPRKPSHSNTLATATDSLRLRSFLIRVPSSVRFWAADATASMSAMGAWRSFAHDISTILSWGGCDDRVAPMAETPLLLGVARNRTIVQVRRSCLHSTRCWTLTRHRSAGSLCLFAISTSWQRKTIKSRNRI